MAIVSGAILTASPDRVSDDFNPRQVGKGMAFAHPYPT